jgi:hypothetical protein
VFIRNCTVTDLAQAHAQSLNNVVMSAAIGLDSSGLIAQARARSRRNGA